MEKKNLIKLYGLIFIIGVLVLMNSVNIAQSENVGDIVINIEQSIVNYRFLGSIVAILGGLGMIKNINIES